MTFESVAMTIARQATATPAAEAVSFYEESWSYAELTERAHRIAVALAALGTTQPEVPMRVGVWMFFKRL